MLASANNNAFFSVISCWTWFIFPVLISRVNIATNCGVRQKNIWWIGIWKGHINWIWDIFSIQIVSINISIWKVSSISWSCCLIYIRGTCEWILIEKDWSKCLSLRRMSNCFQREIKFERVWFIRRFIINRCQIRVDSWIFFDRNIKSDSRQLIFLALT
jgi:hypothetical protein